MNNINQNKYKGMKVEYHILQSFPVTCLNRDDAGAPKTVEIGGVTRARVSSQAWKRQVRVKLQEFGIKLAVRTKHINQQIEKYCLELGAKENEAKEVGTIISEALSKDTLHFFTETEAQALAEFAKSKKFKLKELIETEALKKSFIKEIEKIHKKAFNPSLDGLDIALFGRMVAKAATLTVEAACSFAHAISTHKVINDIDFFTALDDLAEEQDKSDAGSSHLGINEFNSATYYRYISLDIGQLVQTLKDDENLDTALEAFTKALFIAIPFARQTTQTGNSNWDYAKILVRRDQGMQVSFETPVKKAEEGGYLKNSIDSMNKYLEIKEKTAGSLCKIIKSVEWGKDENITIDKVIETIQQSVRG